MTSKAIPGLAKKLHTAKSAMRLDRANPQPFYHYFNNSWTPIRSSSDITKNPSTSNLRQSYSKNVTRIRLTTWNIDFQTPHGHERMAAALEYLSHQHSTQHDDETPSIIFLQEMVGSDLQLIQESGWVQEKFFITDTSSDYWRGSYGTTTMIDKQLVVRGVFRVPYSNSGMERDGLFVDVDVGPPGPEGGKLPITFFVVVEAKDTKKASYDCAILILRVLFRIRPDVRCSYVSRQASCMGLAWRLSPRMRACMHRQLPMQLF
jgi:tyrosyl-DNA phosphodiesterase 2